MLIKSSMESEELAYDTANIVYKNVGPTYNGWWMKEGYGQGYSWVMAEHNDYSVRLFFEFMDTGFCYVKVHFTNGAAYEDLIADSWNYAKESPEYPFEETCDHVRNFLDNFFEVGGGMDMLREKYENGHNGYDVDKFLSSAKKPVKSSLENDRSDLKNKIENMSGEDISKGIKKTIRRNQKPMLGIKYNVLDQNGGVVGTPMNYEDACDLADDIDGEVVPLYSSRKAIKSGTSIKEYAGFKIDDSVKINSPKRGPYKNGKTGIVVGFYKRYDGEILISVQLDEGGLMDFSKDELENLGDSGYHITYLDSSRKPIKSANYNGFNLEARRSYRKGNGYFTTYPVWDTDLDTSIGAIEYHYAVENPYYVAWVYNDFGANKTGRTKAFDTEEECLEWIGEELASGTTARDKLLKYWEELGYDYKSKNLNNSRKPVKSDWKREAEFMNDRIRDDNLLYQVFKIEDEHFGGNFENPDNWDGTHIVYTIENGEITNTEIVDSFEDVIDDGNKYYLSADRDTGYRNIDYVLDRVALWQERNNRGITSSRKAIKSSGFVQLYDDYDDYKTYIVGKTENGKKLYYCEDGQYYAEEDYARPSIKIFDNEADAKKIAKRSKNGFATPLEVE